MTVPVMHDRDSYDRGRREAFLQVRRIAMAAIGSTQPTPATRLLLVLAEVCSVEAEKAAAGGGPNA